MQVFISHNNDQTFPNYDFAS